jgi:NAD(P)-dependent dehydrogenase (short-subunit alcohol dehydrogenase family)
MSLESEALAVTGGGFSDGIGAGIVRSFADEKAKVVITDLESVPMDE